MAKSRTVAVVMSTYLACFRELLRGINAFANAKRTWQIHFLGHNDDYLGFLKRYKTDGLLCSGISKDPGLQALGFVKKSVGVCGWMRQEGLPTTAEYNVADESVGEVAAKYYLQKGYKEFAYFGYDAIWSHKRGSGFKQTICAAGFDCKMLVQAAGISVRGWDTTDIRSQLSDWLRSLKFPVAILACNDPHARTIAEVCRAEGIRIPDDASIMGVDNDDLECELTDPPLSSVAIPWRRIGFDSARHMDLMLEGESPKSTDIFVPPIGVVERLSTDSMAISDQEVIGAIRFIRENAHKQINVDDVLREVPISRRSLEKRFQSLLHRTPLEEIRRVHVERAKMLLATTDLPIYSVAIESGFGRTTWFSEAFRSLVGESPVQYRKRYHRE